MAKFELSGIEDSPVSAATVGAGVGLIFAGPTLGLSIVVGAVVGAVADVFLGA